MHRSHSPIKFLLLVFAIQSCSAFESQDTRNNSSGPPAPSGALPQVAQGSTQPPNQQSTAAPPVTTTESGQTAVNPAGQQRLSKGTGGVAGLTEVSFKDGSGTASSYKINASPEAAKGQPFGLHIHLHGDGGGGYQDFPNKVLANGLIGVAVKAPNRGQTWGRASGVLHAKYVHDLIQNELVKKFNIDLDKIYFSGVSGGSYFLAGHFIPTFGSVYGSGAFLMCGGMAPQVKFENAPFLKAFRIHWEVTAGERQDIKSSVRQSVDGYKKALAATADANPAIESINEEGAGGHCEFDGSAYTTGIQFMMDKKFSSILK